MAVFAPHSHLPSPSLRACQAALAMRATVHDLNHDRARRREEPIRLGIGIARGSVISGAIGARQGRLNLTVIGDAVNLAARLEALTHSCPDEAIFLSETVGRDLGSSMAVAPRGEVAIKGKERPVHVFELRGPPS
jgi:adenylate cyclase